MALIFQPGHKYFFRQTYTVAGISLIFFGATCYTGYRGLRWASEAIFPAKLESKREILHKTEEMTDSSGQANMERPPRNFPSKAKESISSQPKKRFRGTLAIFIQALEGMRIVVELRQDTIVRGLLETADNDMNLTMREVTMTPLEGTKQNLDWLYIKGHHIRYVHIPSKVEPSRIIEQNKRRIMQLRMVHNREQGEVTALKKGEF